MKRSRVARAFDEALGPIPEFCDECGCPNPEASGYLVIEAGKEPPKCGTCGKPVDDDGRSLIPLDHEGQEGFLIRIVLDRSPAPLLDERQEP